MKYMTLKKERKIVRQEKKKILEQMARLNLHNTLKRIRTIIIFLFLFLFVSLSFNIWMVIK